MVPQTEGDSRCHTTSSYNMGIGLPGLPLGDLSEGQYQVHRPNKRAHAEWLSTFDGFGLGNVFTHLVRAVKCSIWMILHRRLNGLIMKTPII